MEPSKVTAVNRDVFTEITQGFLTVDLRANTQIAGRWELN
jgi:hypothetical protein